MGEPLAVDSRGNELLRWLPAVGGVLPAVDPSVPTPLALMVARRGSRTLIVYNRWRECWELPGGMIEPGESAEAAARREFLEETGHASSDVRAAGVATFRLAPDGRLEHGAVYTCAVDEAVPFVPTVEIERIAWWDGSPSQGVTELDTFISRAAQGGRASRAPDHREPGSVCAAASSTFRGSRPAVVARTGYAPGMTDVGTSSAQSTTSAEAQALLSVLERNRRTFAWKTAGLDADGLRATTAASSMTLGGLVKHMALVEADWLAVKLAGEAYGPPWDTVDFDDDPDWDWRTGALDAADEVHGLWRDAVERSRRIVTRVIDERGLDGPASFTWPDGRVPSVRAMLLDMIEEYARHTGHADILREAVDGRVGEGAPRDFTF